MKAPTPKEVVNEWFERVWNSRDKAAIDRMMTEGPAGGAQVCGTTQFTDFQDKLIGAFPDLAVRILRSVGDDTQACLHWRLPERIEASSSGSPPRIERLTSVE